MAWHKFENGPDVAPKPGDTVIIVGGGPAGIHMASLLKDKGVVPIVLEKEDRVGGKSYTIVRDGVPHEMGTCYIHPEYHVPKALFEKYGLTDSLVKPGGPNGDRDIFLNDTTIHKAKHFSSMDGWMYGAVEEQWAGADYTLIPNKLSKLPMLQAMRRYQKVHREVMGAYHGTLPPRLSHKRQEMVNMTFHEFLKKHGCVALAPLLLAGHTAQGYGLLDTIPAFYGLMWFTADLVERFIDFKKDPAKAEPTLRMLKGGWASLWQKMKDQDKLDVRLGHQVLKVLRADDGVTVSGVTSQGAAFQLQGTHVFLACPFPPLAPALTMTAKEQAIFRELKPFCLCTTLYEIDPHPDRTRVICYWPDAMNPDNKDRVSGMLNCERWSAKSVYWSEQPPYAPPAQGNPFLAETAADVGSGVPASGKQVRCGYQFLDVDVWRDADGKVDAAKLRTQLEETLSEQGVTGVKILGQWPWDYFFHFSKESLQKGLLWDIIAMQGANRTFYIGASASFESINDVTNYNHMIMDHFFRPVSRL